MDDGGTKFPRLTWKGLEKVWLSLLGSADPGGAGRKVLLPENVGRRTKRHETFELG